MEEHTFMLELQGRRVGLSYPALLDDELWPFFSQFSSAENQQAHVALKLLHGEGETFILQRDGKLLWSNLVWPHVLKTLCDEIERAFISILSDVVVQAGAVRHKDKSILILGPAGCRKSELTAWFVDNGFDYLADNYVGLNADHFNLHGDRNAISPLAMPIAAHLAAEPHIMSLPVFREAYGLPACGRVFIRPDNIPEDHGAIQSCGLVIVPKFHESANLAVEIVPADELYFLMVQAANSRHKLSPVSAGHVDQFCRAVPAIAIRYGKYEQLAGTVGILTRHLLDSRANPNNLISHVSKWRSATSPLASDATETLMPEAEPLAPTVQRYRKRLTVGMATYDDYDGVYFTLQSLRLHHPDVANDIEFVVVDNNPDGACGIHLKALEKKVQHYRYIPIRERGGTAVRDYVMAEASSDFVLNLDCHVLVAPGAIARLIQYFEANRDTRDLLQGPLLYDDLITLSTHMDEVWRQGMYGSWGIDERARDPDAPPFDIPMQGLGLYACRRSAWQGYNQAFRGFGGEEGYIHEKFRQAGGRTLCLPFLRWMHRFTRPLGVPYNISWEDRIRNYLVGFDELGLPLEPILAHFREHIGQSAEGILESAQKYLFEIKSRS